MTRRKVLLKLLAALTLSATTRVPNAIAQSYQDDEFLEKVASLDIEDLLNQEITSVGKKRQTLSQAAAAIYVLTNEDIRRSGARSIPEALRLVPGLEVARVDAHQWAISSRGFNGIFANKLLVLLDGRSLYSPLFSGVFWDVQDTFIEDIDRIEVIRGPGATLWGANAVNGVINIITRRSKETVGGLLDLGAGNEEQNGGVRYGVELSENAHFRTYAKAKYLDDSKRPGGTTDNYDHWHLMQGGFRFDSEGIDKSTFTFQGDIHQGSEKQETILFSNPNLPPDVDRSDNQMDGGNLIARWSKEHTPGSTSTLQTYFDHVQRESIIFDQSINTVDVDYQHTLKPSDDHEIIAGLGYRYIDDDYNPRTATVDPDRRDYDVYSAFVQDEVFIVPERFSVTLGSKFEENNFSGFEYQPSIRLNGILNEHNSVWAAVSRAIRTPSRADHDIRLPFGPPVTGGGGAPVLLQIQGNRDKDSEKLMAYELGYRARFSKNVSLDLSFFYNDYDDLTTGDPGIPTPGDSSGSFFVLPLLLSNSMHGETFGLEAIKTVNLFESWKIQAGYTFIEDNLRFDDPAAMSVPQEAEDEVPNHMAILRSSVSLTDEIYFDSNLRYMDAIKVFNVEDYLELNLRVAWVVNPNLELSLSGENLLHEEHQEAVPDVIITSPSELERSFFARAIFKF